MTPVPPQLAAVAMLVIAVAGLAVMAAFRTEPPMHVSRRFRRWSRRRSSDDTARALLLGAVAGGLAAVPIAVLLTVAARMAALG